MRMSDLKPLELYATKAPSRAVSRRSTGPVLLLSTRLWDLVPGPQGSSIAPAPEDAPRSEVLSSMGARRGLLVVQAAPLGLYTGALDEQEIASQLSAIPKKGARKLSRLVRRDALDRALEEFRQSLPETLMINVVLLQSVVEPLSKPEKYPCPACPNDVSLDAVGRIRAHEAADGTRCPATRTYMPSKERKTNLLAP